MTFPKRMLTHHGTPLEHYVEGYIAGSLFALSVLLCTRLWFRYQKQELEHVALSSS
jgi:hypothetical protein